MKAKFLVLLAMVLGVVSCQTEPEGLDVNVGGEIDAIVNVTIPEAETRADGYDSSAKGVFENGVLDGDATMRYILQVYYKGEPSQERLVKYSDDKSVAFDVRLVPGRDYQFVVWADVVDGEDKGDKHYNTENLANIQLNRTWFAMDESRDAFTATVAVNEYSSASNITVKLQRPFAKLRVVTTDMVALNNLEIKPTKASVEYTVQHYNAFNAFEGKVINNSNSRDIKHEKFVIAPYGDNSTTDKVLFTDYFFPTEDNLIKFNLEVFDQNNVQIGETVAFNTDIPVNANYLTTIKGNILTDGKNFNVTIEDAFANGTEWNPGDDKYDVEVWDGKTLTAPKYNDTDDVYEISTGSQLAWLAAAVSGTLPDTRAVAATSFAGETFKLTSDINLGENAWKPIGLGGKHFEGIFDGQGHTITGLMVTERFGGDRFALFCSLAGSAQIKNLVIDNAYIKYPADGEDCYASAIAGTIYGNNLFENITVKNSTITGNNKVGAIFAHDGSSNQITINNCHVDNCYIASEDLKDGGCVGGLVGYYATGNEGKPNTISNSSVKNTTIVGINSSNSGKRANSLVIGSIKTKATMELNIVNCVLENNTFSQTIDGTAPVTYVGTFNPQYIGGDREEAHLGKITIDGYEVIANGVGMKDGEYFVMSAQGLAWVEAQVDNYFAGKTIKLANDIDMTGVTIEKPIHFWNGRTTFDGQNHTISNLTMSTTSTEKKPFALFGGTADIKNVKFDNANISGYSYVAVVAGNLYGNIDNCHVANSTVTCTYWMAGAMSGQYNNGNVTNCSVKNTTVTGPAAVGALVGNINETAGERKIENCTVENCTVAQNGSFGGDYDLMFGSVVGLINIDNSKVYINGCEVENTTVKGATAANVFGLNDGDNTTIYVDDYTYTPDGIIKDENGDLIVNSLDSLEAALEAAGAAGAGDTTIVFAENAQLNMTGAEWTPIKVDGYNGADIVTIEGNGAVITGLNAPLFAGGFAGGSGIVIKDLTIKDSNIISANTIGSGAFIESVDSMAKIELTNCHLLNSTVTGGAGSRTGGLLGWTAGYSNQNDGPVKTYVTIDGCSVIGCTITCDGSVGGINGHAGNNDWTYTTIKNCTIKNNTLASTDDGEWRVGVVVGTANVGEVTISNITESGNTLTQTGKTAPEGFKRNYYGRFVPGTTGKLTIDGEEVVIINSAENLEKVIENAQAGDTITIAGDITLTEEVTIPAGVTFNGNGKQINGTLIAGGDITFAGHTKVSAFSAGFSGYEITIGEGACLEITGGGRSTMGYNNTFNITGTITDAESADKTNIQPSLIMPAGISITGGNGLELNIKDAYVQIGSTTSKNSAANGTFTINIENSIAEFTNQFTFAEPTSGKNPTFNLNVKNSVLTTATKLILAAPNCNMVVDNSTIDVKTYFRNSGNVELKNGSVLTGNTIQFSENGGHDGKTIVDASKFTIKASSTGNAYDGRGTGSITLKNGAEVSVDYYKALTINSDANSIFTGTEVF